jgi:hypothetical protein
VITLLFVLWYAEIGLKALAAYRLYHTRALLQFPILFCFLITSVTKSTLLVQARHDPELYATVYSVSVPVMLVLQYLCGIELFEQLTVNFPQFRKPGFLLLTVFGLLGVTASISTQRMGVPGSWGGTREAAILLDRFGLVALFVGLVLMVILVPHVRSRPIPDDAQRAAMILGFYVFGNALTATILVGTDATWRLLPAFLTVVTGLLAAVGWMTLHGKKKEPRRVGPKRSVRRVLQNYLRSIREMSANAVPSS